jgi:acyl-CoA thioesterase
VTKQAVNDRDIARACADALRAGDAPMRELDIEIVSIEPGIAMLAMTVTPAMVNGHGICHGGYLFTLADSACGFACNSRNQRTVTQHCEITFIAPGMLGDRLTARCAERQRGGRSGIYDATVTRGDGTVIAEFRGLTRTIKGTWIPDAKA